MLAGYKIIDYHRAILFTEGSQKTLDGKKLKVGTDIEIIKEEISQNTLFGDTIKETKEKQIIKRKVHLEDKENFKVAKGRLGFFKRESFSKGNVVARWEDIIIAEIKNDDQ